MGQFFWADDDNNCRCKFLFSLVHIIVQFVNKKGSKVPYFQHSSFGPFLPCAHTALALSGWAVILSTPSFASSNPQSIFLRRGEEKRELRRAEKKGFTAKCNRIRNPRFLPAHFGFPTFAEYRGRLRNWVELLENV